VIVDNRLHGNFWDSDCYLVLASYSVSKRKTTCVFTWVGHNCDIVWFCVTVNITFSRIILSLPNMHKILHGQKVDAHKYASSKGVYVPSVVWIDWQSHEPELFVRMFNGRMIVHIGGKVSGVHDVNDRDKYDSEKPRLFVVHGTTGTSHWLSNINYLQVMQSVRRKLLPLRHHYVPLKHLCLSVQIR